MSTFTFIAETKDLCRALAAAAPFANEKSRGFDTVRVFVDDTNIYVGATNGNAMGLALASTFGLDGANDDGEPLEQQLVEVDLLPAQCRAIISLFKAGASDDDKKDGEPGAELRIDVTDDEVTVTDASGLLEGQSLTLPRPPTADNAAAVIIAPHDRNHMGANPNRDRPPRYYASSLALVIKAAKVYGHDLIFEHWSPANPDRTGSTLVRCGESFLAVLVDSWKTEDTLADESRWREDWATRLGPLKDLALAITRNDPPKEK